MHRHQISDAQNDPSRKMVIEESYALCGMWNVHSSHTKVAKCIVIKLVTRNMIPPERW
jgi:hypothetical protein